MTRICALVIVAVAGCSSSQTAPGPGEAQTVPTSPEPHVEATPPEGAVASFPKAAKDGQKRSEELVEKGRAILKSKGKAGASEAAALFSEATKEDTRNAMAYWELGWAQQIGGDFDAALGAWQTLKQLDPKFPDLDHFTTIAASRKNEPASPRATRGSTGDEPPLATTPAKKKARKAGEPKIPQP